MRHCDGLLAAGFACLLMAGCSQSTATQAVQRPVLAVEAVTPSKESWPDTVVASGEIAPWQEAIIGAEVAGVRLDEVFVNVGDTVKKNQLIARYSEDSLRADLAQLDAAVEEATANLSKALADSQRADKLEATQALSGQAIQAYRTQADVARAQVASVRAQRDAQALRLRNARIMAPDDGVISSRLATVGSVSVVGVELFRLVRRSRLEWRAELPAEVLGRLNPGDTAVLPGIRGNEIRGTLRQNSPTVDVATRNGLAYVDLPADSGLSAGMYVSGRFMLTPRDAVALPASSLVLRDGNAYLMKIDSTNRVHRVVVTTGRRYVDAIEIVSELAPGQRFVKSGGAFVNDGDLVRISAVDPTTP